MGDPIIPNGDQLLDIRKCRCFEDLDAQPIHPNSCDCRKEDKPHERADIWSETEGSLDFYVNQRTTQEWKAVFACSRCHVETREGDAEDAGKEDAAKEDAEQMEDDIDLGERQAQVQFEEEQLLEAGDDLEDTINASFSSPSDSPEEEEIEEETGRQRREDTLQESELLR